MQAVENKQGPRSADVDGIIQEATDVPEQVKRYVLKKLRKDDGGLAQRKKQGGCDASALSVIQDL